MVNNELTPRVYCLMGPTASGKTAAALELVKQLPCDIISVDSAMIYREMDIGTAKPSAEILKVAPHRLIDICDPSESYSAADFCRDAQTEINNILTKNRIPLLVGGTMMYFNALQQGLSKLPAADEMIRQELIKQAETIGWAAMHERLVKIDPVIAQKIHPNDPQRIQRALEVFMVTGTPLSELQNKKSEQPPYHFINIALTPNERSVLHHRIEQRFDEMVAQGFVDEVQALYGREDLNLEMPSMRAVGYRQTWQYIAGILNKAQWRDQSIAATRQLAKRQLTWLRSWSNLSWVNSEQSQFAEQILSFFVE